jgi:hypothetical protein
VSRPHHLGGADGLWLRPWTFIEISRAIMFEPMLALMAVIFWQRGDQPFRFARPRDQKTRSGPDHGRKTRLVKTGVALSAFFPALQAD